LALLNEAMTKAERRAYAKQREQDYLEECERTRIREQLDVIGKFRDFLLSNGSPDELMSALDDWTGKLTGDRTFFWSRNYNTPSPKILLPHERKRQSS